MYIKTYQVITPPLYSIVDIKRYILEDDFRIFADNITSVNDDENNFGGTFYV